MGNKTEKGKISNATEYKVWFKIKNSFIHLDNADQQIGHNFGVDAGINYGAKTQNSG